MYSNNYFNSLPSDLIRNIFEWDSTYRDILSTPEFACDIQNGYWSQKKLQKEIINLIYFYLESFQDEEEIFANRFLELNLGTEDNEFYFTRQTEGMTEDEINSLPIDKTACCDLRKDTCIFFSFFEDVLRWVIIPKTFEDKAKNYFSRRETERGNTHLYDGMCSTRCCDMDIGRYSRYTISGRVSPVVRSINIPLIFNNDDNTHCEYYDGIRNNILQRMSDSVLSTVINYTSKQKFILWI